MGKQLIVTCTGPLLGMPCLTNQTCTHKNQLFLDELEACFSCSQEHILSVNHQPV